MPSINSNDAVRSDERSSYSGDNRPDDSTGSDGETRPADTPERMRSDESPPVRTRRSVIAAGGAAGLSTLGTELLSDGGDVPAEAASDCEGDGTAARRAESLERFANRLADDDLSRFLFGWSVAVDGRTAVVGRIFDDDVARDAGAAHVFARDESGWSRTATLVPDDGEPGDWFGYSVALDGDRALVGAVSDEENGFASGAAYVFTRRDGRWSQFAKLAAGDGGPRDSFGRSVAVDGPTAVVGAPGSGDGLRSGSAYVYTRQGREWTETAKLAPDGADGDGFGHAVALDGDTALVGAHRHGTGNGANAGAAYVFSRRGGRWSRTGTVTAADGSPGDFFGSAVALDGSRAVVGAAGDGGGTDPGAAYVFDRRRGRWSQSAKLVPEDGAATDRFGVSVSANEETVIVGAAQEGDGPRPGAAYVFGRDDCGWTQVAKLPAGDGAAGDQYGRATAIGGRDSLAGAAVDEPGRGVDVGEADASSD